MGRLGVIGRDHLNQAAGSGCRDRIRALRQKLLGHADGERPACQRPPL